MPTIPTLTKFKYKTVLKKILFLRDPEDVHDHFTRVGVFLGKHGFTRSLVSRMWSYADPSLVQTIRGITFSNPIGLSAGFDKNAQLTDILPSLGFGFVELGSVTGEPCDGNPRPRLWRLPKSRALVVYYGLKNDGAEAISSRLQGKKFKIPTGISVAKTNNEACAQTDAGIADYAKAFSAFLEIGDFITVNISCPNTFGGEPFTDPGRLELLFQKLDAIPASKPIFLKLSPDITTSQLDAVIDVASKHRINGFICSNLSKKRDSKAIVEAAIPDKGGISGKVSEGPANDQLTYVAKKCERKFILIGSGGVFTAEDAYKKIRLGASLVQLITGMIFEGPQVIGEINRGLVKLLKRDGFKNISEAVGADVWG